MKSMYFEGEAWIKLKDAPRYCEVVWKGVLGKLEGWVMPDDLIIKLKKIPKVKRRKK